MSCGRSTKIRARMNRHLVPLAALLVAALAVPPAVAGAAEPGIATTATTTTTAPTATTPTPTTPTTPPVSKPRGGRISLTYAGTFTVGRKRMTVTQRTVRVDGRVAPYVAGQQVVVHVWRGHKLIKDVTVRPRPTSTKLTATFSVRFASDVPGPIDVVAIHRATAQQVRVEQAAAPLSVVAPVASGPFVGLLQQRLAALGYAVPQSGAFDGATQRAVLAFRKVNGMARTSELGSGVVDRLLRGVGGFHVRYPQHGRHVEANLGQQVLALIDHGKVFRTYTTSSGKPSTPTVLGTFRFYLKTPGTNEKGMVDSNYFIGGYAIHGYVDVPSYAASHGCLRIPIPDAWSVYNWVHVGDIIDVYY